MPSTVRVVKGFKMCLLEIWRGLLISSGWAARTNISAEGIF